MLRHRLKPYIAEQMRTACQTGLPIMRPLLLDFPDDKACWPISDQYLFGSDILVAPIVEQQCRSRRVYLPAGTRWQCAHTGKSHSGGQVIEVEAPLCRIPVFVRSGTAVIDCFRQNAEAG